MWKPPERLKFASALGRVPTREEAAASLLFSPVRVGKLTLARRSWVPAMVPWRATAEGFVTPEILAWYGRFAEGQPGAIVVEATGICDVPSGPLLRIGHDRFIPGLTRLVETVRRASQGKTRLFIQLIDFLAIRRRPEPRKFFERYLEIKDHHRATLDARALGDDEIRKRLAAMDDAALAQVLTERELEALRLGYRERVTDIEFAHIRNLPEVLPPLFAAAALRARESGFDGVELHYAHAYTMASFLSATNTRSDFYGGARENRLRLPLEVFHAVRERCGSDFVTGCRFLAQERIPGGSTLEDAVYFGVEFARAGMDFLSTSRGGKFDDAKQPAIGAASYPYTGRSGYECMPQYLSDARGPFGRNIAPTRAIRRAIREAGFATPVVCIGGVHNFAMAEAMLADQSCDIVGAARQFLADPDWLRKTALGLGHTMRVCQYTNYCEGLDQKHKPVTCQLWDREALDEPGVALSDDGRRRLVPPPWRPPE